MTEMTASPLLDTPTARGAPPRWIGRWILGVGVFHLVFGAWWFATPLLRIARSGLWSSVGWSSDGRALAFWFVLAGLLLLLVGAMADWTEAHVPGALPRFFGWTLLAITLVGCVCLPVSGFWALLVPAIGAIRAPG